MDENFELEEQGVYKTNVGDLIKITKLKPDSVHFFNISESCNQILARDYITRTGKIKERVR